MRKPNTIFITGGTDRTRRMEFDDRFHYFYRMGNHDPANESQLEICGHETSKICINVPLTRSQFVYCLSRLRQPGARPLREDETLSCFPVYAVISTGVTIDGKLYSFDDLRENREEVLDAYEDFWDARLTANT